MSEKFEAGSSKWIEYAVRTARQLAEAAGEDLASTTFSLCETYTNVPEHLGAGSDREISWHLRVRGGKVEGGPGKIEDADLHVTVDYEVLPRLARIHFGREGEAGLAKFERLAGEAVAEGKLQMNGDPARNPPFLEGLHDRLAEVTA